MGFPSIIPGHLATIVDVPSLTLWYPRHSLQMRVGLFFGAASLAGKLSLATFLKSPPCGYRCILRSPGFRNQFHEWNARITWVVMDLRKLETLSDCELVC